MGADKPTRKRRKVDGAGIKGSGPGNNAAVKPAAKSIVNPKPKPPKAQSKKKTGKQGKAIITLARSAEGSREIIGLDGTVIASIPSAEDNTAAAQATEHGSGGAAGHVGGAAAASDTKLSNKQRKRLRDRQHRAAHRAAKLAASKPRTAGGAPVFGNMPAVEPKHRPGGASDDDCNDSDDGGEDVDADPMAGLTEAAKRLLEQREQARAARDFDTADGLRESLRELGLALCDRSKTWLNQSTGATGSWLAVYYTTRGAEPPAAEAKAAAEHAKRLKLGKKAKRAGLGATGGGSGPGGSKVKIAKEQIPGTLFIRNVPRSATQQSLTAVLEPFAAVSECRLVLDKQTRKPVGNAFADLQDGDDCKACCMASRKGEIVLDGHALRIDEALTHTGVQAIQERNVQRPKAPPKRKRGGDSIKGGKGGKTKGKGGKAKDAAAGSKGGKTLTKAKLPREHRIKKRKQDEGKAKRVHDVRHGKKNPQSKGKPKPRDKRSRPRE